ncbi:uncharacterized protein LOC123532337 [Mercenaria mercenaria]|uniref:uncharacterized protein LOC123532337 n=1 Tax=Mercenaria mercenaria TaxID=6596 RepID=UPI00234F73C7|nr:uncharacterized protein LOC123532337 [Mercenaria mercenaria]
MQAHQKMADYPGPFCQEYGITTIDLSKGAILKPTQSLKNGLVLEINKFVEEHGQNFSHLYNIIAQLNPAFSKTTVKYLKNKVSRTCEQKKSLLSKKKVPGVKNLKDLLNREFKPTVGSANQSPDEINLEKTISQIENISVCDDSVKSQNLSNYESQKLQKHSAKLENKIKEQKTTLNEIDNRIGHYSIRNVNKRDETAKKNLHLLRDSQRLNRKQEKSLEKTSSELKQCKIENSSFSAEIVQLNEKIESLNKELQTLNECVSTEKRKKISAQKYNSYVRTEMKSLKEKVTEKELQLKKLQQQKSCTDCEGRENEILELTDHVNNLMAEKVRMKNDDGSYSNEVRLCVMELSGLEVAVEKVSPVIQAISKHLFHVNLEKKDLPSSTTTQSIVDEGHFIAKSYISHQLSETENWGLHRDGTSRKKQKLLDTSVRLASRETVSLGFNRVAHETAATINSVTKEHLSELADLHSNIKTGESEEDYIKNSLKKLSYTMSDRAANEKKADTLLDEWRSEVLDNTDSHEQVHHFHCMAHVLLGFHNYICGTDLKEHESAITKEHGPLGRDVLPFFKFWSKKGTVLERALRTTSEVFGPAGNHHGVRNSWEAHCAENGVKSVIGNYRDNRFNALFQTAAEVYLHREDFITVLQNVKSNNLLVQSVLADLQSKPIMAEIQSLGLFYLQLTGPYWNMVVNDTVPYLQLYKEV